MRNTLRDIREIGAAVGLPGGGEEVAGRLEAELRDLARTFPRPPRVLVE